MTYIIPKQEMMLERTNIKVCGLTTAEQAVDVEKAGADLIGLVFAFSPRQISEESAAEVVTALTTSKSVGVFVDNTPDEINRIAETTGLSMAQLHGEEKPEIVKKLRIPCIKAFRVAGPGFIDEVSGWIAKCGKMRPEAILLDAFSPVAAGGTGETFNWEYVSRAVASGEMDDMPPMILAGGLNPANVADAITTLNPWGVDCSSGVESRPGVKDIDKVRQFIANVWDRS